jgi:hypothetical protein
MNKRNSSWKWNVLAIAAGMAVTGAVASAQETRLKANVPFAFSINHSDSFAPGNYVVSRDRNVWRVRNEDTRQTVIIGTAVAYQGREAETSSLRFECVGNRCQLRAIHAGGSSLGAEFPAPKLSKSDAAEVAVANVPLQPIQGD